MPEESVKLFISYCHRDETLRQQLDKHLAPLKGQKVIEAWHDRQIRAGDEWANQIDHNLNKADIVLLLISPDFVASDYCSNIELEQAVKRHENGEAIIVPVILEPCDWSWLPFAKFQAFPKDGKAITTWGNQNEAFVDVAQGLRKVAQELFAKRKLLAEQKEANRARYLQKVEEVLSDGKISIVQRDTLEELRETLGLTPAEATEIETRAYEPYSRVEENLNKYKQTLNRLIEKGYYPFSEEIEKDLENRQRDLGLKPEDAARISKPILDQAELDDQTKKKQLTEAEKLQALERQRQEQARVEYENRLRRYEEEFTKAIAAQYPIDPFVQDELNQFQQSLALSDEDVARIEAPLTAPKAAAYEQRLADEQRRKEEAEQRRKEEAERQLELERQQKLEQQRQEQLKQEAAAKQRQAEEQERQRRAAEELKRQQAEAERLRQEALEQQPRELASEKGIDYTKLRDLLQANQWHEADHETYLRMLEAVGREDCDWIRAEELRTFPCADLQTIDRLWVKHSNGHFGFSVQKKIWQECGSPTSTGKDWDRFCVKIGWKKPVAWGSGYVQYLEIVKDPRKSPTGAAPCIPICHRGIQEYYCKEIFSGFRTIGLPEQTITSLLSRRDL